MRIRSPFMGMNPFQMGGRNLVRLEKSESEPCPRAARFDAICFVHPGSMPRP